MPIKKKPLNAPAGAKSGSDFLKKYFSQASEKIRTNKRKQFAFFILGFLAAYLLLNFFVSLVPDTAFKEATGGAVQGVLSAEGVWTRSQGAGPCEEVSWVGDTMQGQCYSFLVSSDSLHPGVAVPAANEAAYPADSKTIVISWLCTGVLEIIVLVSAIIASFGVSWKKKLVGIAAAVILGIIFNLLRIVVTVNLILTQNVQTVELAHDALFRLVLFVYIVAVYVGWFYWAARQEK